MGCGKEEKCIENCGGGVRRKDRLEDVSIGGRILVKMDPNEVGFEGADWIHLDMYSRLVDKWRAPVNMLVTLLLPYNVRYVLNI